MSWPTRNTFIYFVATDDGARIKIGCSENPTSRILSLMAWSPFDLKLLADVDGTADDERALHAHFIEHRARGEWFHTNPPLLALIETVIATKQIPNHLRGKPGQRNPFTFGVKRKPRSEESRQRQRAESLARWDGIRFARSLAKNIRALGSEMNMSELAIANAAGIPTDMIEKIHRDHPYLRKCWPDEVDRIERFVRSRTSQTASAA